MFYLRPEDHQPGVVSHNAALSKVNMLGNGSIPHLTGFSRAEFPPGEKAEAHRHHDMAEIFWVESGCGAINIDGRDFALEPAVCVVVQPEESHEVRSTADSALSLLYFWIRL